MNLIAIVAFLALCAGLYFMWRIVRPSSSAGASTLPVPGGRSLSKSIPLIVFDGHTAVIYPSNRCPEGVKVGDSIYESAMLLPVIGPRGDTASYILGADRVALAQHDAFEASRVRILRNRFTKSGGDFADLLKLVSSVSIILVSFFLWMQLRGISGGMNELAVRIGAVETTLSKPLNTVPIPQIPQQPATPQQ